MKANRFPKRVHAYCEALLKQTKQDGDSCIPQVSGEFQDGHVLRGLVILGAVKKVEPHKSHYARFTVVSRKQLMTIIEKPPAADIGEWYGYCYNGKPFTRPRVDANAAVQVILDKAGKEKQPAKYIVKVITRLLSELARLGQNPKD